MLDRAIRQLGEVADFTPRRRRSRLCPVATVKRTDGTESTSSAGTMAFEACNALFQVLVNFRVEVAG